MPATVCPHCHTAVDLDAEDVGELVECPACQKAFTLPLPIARPVRRPRRPPRRFAVDDHSSPDDLIRHAEFECSSPADGLFVVGALTVFFGLGAAVFGGGIPLCTGQASGQALPGLSDQQTAAFYFVYGLYSFLIGVFQMYAGRQMRRAKQYPLCVVACVLSLVPGIGPCVMGTLFGYTGLTRLRDPLVKKGFAANRPGYDPDAAG